MDCRYCWENKGCAINDDMQAVYDFIQECDNVLISSPIYFSELTGKILDFSSRLQTYFASRYFRKEEPIRKRKRGAVILAGGSDGRMDKAFETATTILHHLCCDNIHDLVFSHNTNQVHAVKDKQACEGVYEIIRFFNRIT